MNPAPVGPKFERHQAKPIKEQIRCLDFQELLIAPRDDDRVNETKSPAEEAQN